MYLLVYIQKLIMKWTEVCLFKNPLPRPTYVYYDLDPTNPFHIDKTDLEKLSQSFHAW